jgi:hypothetical protein
MAAKAAPMANLNAKTTAAIVVAFHADDGKLSTILLLILIHPPREYTQHLTRHVSVCRPGERAAGFRQDGRLLSALARHV